MTNKEMIANVLINFSCMSSSQIKGAVYRKYNVIITPQTAAGVLRPLIGYGWAASSKDGNNKTIYWLTNEGKEKLFKKK